MYEGLCERYRDKSEGPGQVSLAEEDSALGGFGHAKTLAGITARS